MNIDSLTKIMKMTGATDSLKIRHQTDADTVNFQCEGSDDRIADFDLKLMQIESEHMEIPEQHYKVVAKLPSSEFQKVCRDLKEFGETIQISGSKEGLKFMVQGDLGSGNVMLKPREGEKPEEKVSLTVHEPVTATFALRYLVNFAKACRIETSSLCLVTLTDSCQIGAGYYRQSILVAKGVTITYLGNIWEMIAWTWTLLGAHRQRSFVVLLNWVLVLMLPCL